MVVVRCLCSELKIVNKRRHWGPGAGSSDFMFDEELDFQDLVFQQNFFLDVSVPVSKNYIQGGPGFQFD